MAANVLTADTYASGSTSSALIARLKAGDGDAWRTLVQLYGPSVYRWCRRWPLGREDVADVFQDVFATVHRHIADFRRDRPSDSLRGWLQIITKSRAADHLRRRQREPSAAGGTDAQQQLLSAAEEIETAIGPPPFDALSVHAAETIIRAEFEERTWQLFARSVIDGQSTAQVAEEFDVSPGAVRQARFRVLKRLREVLE